MGQAIGEGLKFLESPGAQGNKQDVVNGATMTMMKLMVQSKFSRGVIIGGNSSGSMSTIMGLVSLIQMYSASGLIVPLRPASLCSV
jgi:hypothetical protein